jgi:hypothetical protein
MQDAFHPKRQAPFIVWVLRANQPLVQLGGQKNLREDFYDNANNSVNKARTSVYSAYDVAMSGGEPYANWI